MPSAHSIFNLVLKAAKEQGKCPDVITTPHGNVVVSHFISDKGIQAINTHLQLTA
jgi:hypothetical protein